ncbi:MAG: Arc family DNA-binding protein, partial [Deferribacteres bacterium]|nr:Arc family DNA-binding protein [Deferribacteres bacterium]
TVAVVTYTVKNIPDPLYKKLKENARINNRSINDEIIVCLENSLCCHEISPKKFLQDVRKLRETIKAPLLTDDILRDCRNDKRM